MLRPRIIPCLLVHKGGLVKTCQFSNPTYVGDPLNAVRIFNEKEVDELVVLDIDATVRQENPNYDLISQLAAECRMPLTYGGGVKDTDQIERIISLGVEKVAISAAAVSNPHIITAGARRVGSQSIAVVADIRIINKGDYVVFTNNGQVNTGKEVTDFAIEVEDAGAGELIVNNIDRDGMTNGYDFNLIDQCRSACHLPITALGGAGTLEDIQALVRRFPVIGAAAGSIFVFKGKYRAVLINYPNRERKNQLICTVVDSASK